MTSNEFEDGFLMANSRRFQTVLQTRTHLLQMRTLVLECDRVARY
jgi:hypothetical protein